MGETHTSISPNDLIARMATRDCPIIIDVRRAKAFAGSTQILPTSTWRAPEVAASWAASLPRDRDIVVYCVHGHEVSQSVAEMLRAAGLPARFLEGGIEDYRAAGGPIQLKTPSKPEGADHA